MSNVPEWVAVAVVFVISSAVQAGIARAKMEALVKKLEDLIISHGKLDSEVTRVNSAVTENQPILNHLHEEAYKIREKMENYSKSEVALKGLIQANKNNLASLKEDMHRRIDTVKEDGNKVIVDIYKQIDSVKFDIKDLSHKN